MEKMRFLVFDDLAYKEWRFNYLSFEHGKMKLGKAKVSYVSFEFSLDNLVELMSANNGYYDLSYACVTKNMFEFHLRE